MNNATVSANIARVHDIYAAFGRGDIPSILEAVHADVDWEFGASPKSVAIPWVVPGRGRATVVTFLEALRDNLRFEAFEVLALMGDGDYVVALVRLEAVHVGSGRRLVEQCEPHVWRLVEGQVVAMRHAADTLHQAEVAGLVRPV